MKIEFEPDRSLYPFESRWFDSSAGRMHYIDEGSGTPLVFFHGNPMWSFLYRHLVTRLRDRFRCVAMDYLGFGLSEHPDAYGYTVEEHAKTAGELVDSLGLEAFVTMGQDWGGPISLAIGTERADRVGGVILGNTWFWPATTFFRVFSKLMGSRPVQRRIIRDNLFVERMVPPAMARKLTEREMEHYRKVQPTPEARRGVAMLPRQIVDAKPLLARLERDVPAKLGSKRALIVWGMGDLGFRPSMLERVRTTFGDSVVVKLKGAKHYIQEDAPDVIAEAIAQRFG